MLQSLCFEIWGQQTRAVNTATLICFHAACGRFSVTWPMWPPGPQSPQSLLSGPVQEKCTNPLFIDQSLRERFCWTGTRQNCPRWRKFWLRFAGSIVCTCRSKYCTCRSAARGTDVLCGITSRVGLWRKHLPLCELAVTYQVTHEPDYSNVLLVQPNHLRGSNMISSLYKLRVLYPWQWRELEADPSHPSVSA